jgi:hypothetical protein
MLRQAIFWARSVFLRGGSSVNARILRTSFANKKYSVQIKKNMIKMIQTVMPLYINKTRRTRKWLFAQTVEKKWGKR